jgi:hypothetical protein
MKKWFERLTTTAKLFLILNSFSELLEGGHNEEMV